MRNKPNIPSKSNIPPQWYEKYLKELSEEDKNKLLSKPMPKLNTSIPSEKPSSTYVRPKEAFNTIEEAKRRDIPKSETVEYLKELQSKFKQPNPITGEYELATGRADVAGIFNDPIFGIIAAASVPATSGLGKLVDYTINPGMKAGSAMIKKEASRITYNDLAKLPYDHPIFKNFSKDSWDLIKNEKGEEYVNNRIATKLSQLETYPNVIKTQKQIDLIDEAKRDIKEFVISDDWFNRIKKANPELTDAQIKKLQIIKQSTLSHDNIHIKGKGSIASSRGGEFINDPYNPRVNIREQVEGEHLRSLSVHELGHSQTSGAKLPSGKGWHETMEQSGSMPKLTPLGEFSKDYIGSSEEIRQRALEIYIQAKRKGLLEKGKFTENTYNKALELVNEDFSKVPAFDNMKYYEKNSLIDYINKFYSTISAVAVGSLLKLLNQKLEK